MNNYLAILNFLRPHAGDNKYHQIEELLNNLGLENEEAKKGVLGDLSYLKFIGYQGGTQGGGGITFYDSQNGSRSFGGDSWYKAFEAKITIAGLTYLKEEIQMEKEGTYNIHFTGNQNLLVVGSKNVNINVVDEIEKRIDEIANRLKEADDATTGETYLSTLNQLKQEVKTDSVSRATFQNLLSIGSNVSSVGSLVVSLIQLLQTPG